MSERGPETRYLSTKRLEKALIIRGLLPSGCRLVEVSITPASALVIRYEVFVTVDQLGLIAEAMKEAADDAREAFTYRAVVETKAAT